MTVLAVGGYGPTAEGRQVWLSLLGLVDRNFDGAVALRPTSIDHDVAEIRSLSHALIVEGVSL